MPAPKPKKGAIKQRKYQNGDHKGGPTPARHIPWPEIFKHHQSVVDGHLRMLEMVQKHTVVGTPNYQVITPLVEKTKQMAFETRDTARNFVPPKDHFGKVPIGSSSDSMYPGYSPGDLEYGEAQQEAGQAIAEARRKGVKWEPPAEYLLGQNRTGKKTRFFAKGQDTSGSGSGSGSDGDGDSSKPAAPAIDDTVNGDSNQYFMVDTKPTPVNVNVNGLKGIPNRGKKSGKQSADNADSGDDKSKEAPPNTNSQKPAVSEEFENIDAEVEARLKAKEDRKKNKEKKRKRESDDSMIVPPNEEAAENKVAVEKPKKKKTKKDSQGRREEESSPKKRKGDYAGEIQTTGITAEGDNEGEKKKKRKKSKKDD